MANPKLQGKKFEKGKSGNPGGRPKVISHIRDLAREQTENAINALVAICNDVKAPPSARVAASTALLDRGYGKPTQYIEESANPIDALSEHDQQTLFDALEAISRGENEPSQRAKTTH